ncbi:MAG: hypothetical protein IJV11_06995 [Muribaculaceae bacterium]|nr:hypothetical protein [Muribaculaceae bacterium]
MKDYSDFRDRFDEWWDIITLVVLLLSFVLLVIFCIFDNYDGIAISTIVLGISFGLHGDSPLNPGGKVFKRWF